MAEKQPIKEQIKKLTDQIEAGIKALFQSGDLEKYQAYLRTMSHFHHYSVNNQMLIFSQCPHATLVAGYQKWQNQFSRHVLRGEKGISILAPTPYKIKVEKEKLDPDTKLPLLDADGKLAGVTLDELELSVSADGTGKVTTPTDTRTKRQKGKDYPLAEVSGLKKGWAEQADAFGSWLEGKTPDEVKKLKTDADGKPTDADLLSGCTIAVDRYRDAVVRACENAQVLGAARGDTVKLGVEVAEMPQGLTGTDDKDAQVQAKITLAVVTMDENARVTSAIGDMTEPELSVSADGTVSAPREPVYTKNELGDRYGMRSASALGKEWYEHSAGWCGYLKGKNAVEIGKLSTDGTDADLKALCTISVTDLQKAVLKAMAEQ